ncbi:MAG: DUF418 domain-containing protein [Bryobacterales bacterium]|nr:DUF418 domain-containing protein [Bryobacterales bacterium]
MRPVRAEERIESIDVLRGFSLLGILLLNIASFALPSGAYMNPQVYGGATGANFTYWLWHMVLFDGKMRAIFSMLFGTGAIVLTSRAERRGAGVEIADIYYRRTMWLIVFGLVHAYLIWYGDILYAYGVVGLLLFPFRKASARALIITGVIVLALHSMQGAGGMFAIGEMKQTAEKAAKAEKAGQKLTEEEKSAAKDWAALQELFSPTKEAVEKEIKAHREGWVSALKHRAGMSAQFQTSMFFQFVFLDVFGMLILGMGLAKAGVFDAALSYRAYAWMIAVGLGIGVPLNYWAASKWAASNYGIPEFLGYIASTADPGRFLVAAAYVGAIMILCKAGVLGWIRMLLGSVGRMALTNYLLTSIVLTFVFDGWGLGLFAKYERHQLIWFVLGMWAINLVLSPIWLRYFRFGPAEWAWRSLTYWRRQPLRRIVPAEPEKNDAAPLMQEA